ncbi:MULTISPECIES: DoxX family protein [Actinomyces]|uniref:DoxX family protein n=1 Tax=Actinomyces marmotae TaxID=2737173 RepID=A0A6M8B8S3_9ACTO|nr:MULTISPECIES: DoxX family protein [Actinomyces]QKD79633.1 DoxX family protein [Actinomyces marmotae]
MHDSTTPEQAPEATARTGSDIVTSPTARRALASGRIIVGAYLLWAFFDKVFGLGYVVPPEGAWIRGGTPAQGFINHIKGPFAGVFSVFANPVGDVLFMAALLGIGAALVLGIGLRIAAASGTLLMLMLYLAEFPLINGGTNPIIDDHWLFAAIMITSALTLAGDTWGLGRRWAMKVGDGWLR